MNVIPHNLPTNLYTESIAVMLFATAYHHSTKHGKYEISDFPFFFFTSLVYQQFRVLPLNSFGCVTTWSAPSNLSHSQYFVRPHEVFLMTVAMYISSIVADKINTSYKSVLRSILTLFFLSSHEIHSSTFLWRTWHHALPKLCGVPIKEMENMLLFVFICTMMLSQQSTMKTDRKKEEKKQALLFQLPNHFKVALIAYFSTVLSGLPNIITEHLFHYTLDSPMIFLSLLVLILLLLMIDIFSSKSTNKQSNFKLLKSSTMMQSNYYITGIVFIYFVGLILIGLLCNPLSHKSFGHHQPFGGSCGSESPGTLCRKQATTTKWKLCWYGICGRSREENGRSLIAATIFAFLSGSFFVGMFIRGGKKSQKKGTKQV